MVRTNRIYDKLGVRPVINAGGNTTLWGGSTPPEEVRREMNDADASYVEMQELLDRSGDYLAETLGVEGAHITSGCFAALVLSTAACLTQGDMERTARLPETDGRNEIIALKSLRYAYRRSHTVPGGRIVEAGDEDGCTAQQLVDAIGPNTAAVTYIMQPGTYDSTLSLDETAAVARDHGVPIIVDAASQIYPLDHFRSTAQAGDLVCFGTKYVGAPHSTGFLCGKKDLVDAAALQGFIGFEASRGNSVGRGYKVDRQDIVGVVSAMERWFAIDHEARLIDVGERLETMAKAVEGIPGVTARIVEVPNYVQLDLLVTIDADTTGKDAYCVAAELLEGDPRVRTRGVISGDDTISITANTMFEGEEQIVADRLREVLGA